ncbi:MAG: MmcQ/YjbR family DNA-binding protein [Bacteroides sp.]|nr:MmcQ/YjbR family DNA-binding protein [Bacteroides sp.]
MDVSEFRDFCLSLPDVTEKMPFRQFKAAESILAFYVGGHIFCYYDIDRFEACTMKCPPNQIVELEEEFTSVGPPYNMNHKYWIGIKFKSDMPDGKLMELVRQSYEIVKAENTNNDMEMEKAAWHYAGKAQEILAWHIIGLEKAALDKWFNGDTFGYSQLWSRQNFSYFDAVVTERIDSHEEIEKVLAVIEGKLSADTYDFHNPRVQFSDDLSMGVLTYQLYAKTTLIDMEYNCIEVYHKEADGEWHVVHSTWSFIKPMEKNFNKAEQIV